MTQPVRPAQNQPSGTKSVNPPFTSSSRTALITGASGGIGLELAKLFARDKYALVLVARSKSTMNQLVPELQKLGSPRVLVIGKDLAELEAPDEIFEYTERLGLAIDVLVNNAGFGARGAFSALDLDTQLDMIQLNVVALTHLTKLYLPSMMKRATAAAPCRIMNVASTAAFQPGPFMAVYYATKAFVLSFSEAIAEELSGSNVTVTCLCPGATSTGFAERAGMANSKLFKVRVMDATTVAREGYAAMNAGKSLVVTGWKNKLMTLSVRFSPRSVVRKAVRRIQS